MHNYYVKFADALNKWSKVRFLPLSYRENLVGKKNSSCVVFFIAISY